MSLTHHMKKFLLGLLLGILLTPLAFYIYVGSGAMPVATKGAALPFERKLARLALHAAMDPEIGKISPIPASEENLLAGAKVYQAQCAVCHGHLGQPQSAIAKGLFPHAPQLLPPKKGVTDDPVGEIYWKARNGIRLTGMPGYIDSLSDNELWQVSMLLHEANKLPASVQSMMRASGK